VADRQLAAEAREVLLVEHLRDEAEIAQGGQPALFRYGDPGRLLAAVLERVQAEVREPRDITAWSADPEDAAHQPLPTRPATDAPVGAPGAACGRVVTEL
jgi:hypothetical protein